MKFYNKHKSLEFNELYNEISKTYYKIFLNKKNNKIYWYGIASLPLIIFTTAFVFKNFRKLNNNLLNINSYDERININYFKSNKLKKFVIFFFYQIKNFIISKKKIFTIYSSNNLIKNYCIKKKLCQIKLDPIIFLSKKRIDNQKIESDLILFLEEFIKDINKKFFKNKKRKSFFTLLINKFLYFYKIYNIYLIKTKSVYQNFLSGYSSIFYIRLYLAALKYHNNSFIYSITHGNVEILNQDINIISDGMTISDYSISQNKKFFKVKNVFFKKNNEILYKPKFISLNEKYKIKYNNKGNFKISLIKKILIIGYPFSGINFSNDLKHIDGSTMYHTENELINLMKKKYDVFYKAHPDSAAFLKSKIKINDKNYITEKFENIFKDYDCLFFTYHKSTALSYAFLSDKPIFIFKYKNLELEKKSYLFFKKKVFFLNYFFNGKKLSVDIKKIKKVFNIV